MIITRAPLRISFAGGGTDLPAFYEHNDFGCVVSTSITKYVYVTLNSKFDGAVSVRYSRHELVNRVKDLEHNLIRGILESYGVTNGIEIVIASDVPSRGSGLGASSALTVALCLALEAWLGNVDKGSFHRIELAGKAADIEINKVGSIIGKQDHFASAIGGLNLLTFQKTGVSVKSFARTEFVSELEGQSMLFYLNAGHKYDGHVVLKILKDQAAEMQLNSQSYRLQRDNAIRLWEHMGYEVIERFMDHVNENWRIKRTLHPEITNESIDLVIAKALSKGATAAKLCGVGGGGFLYLMVPPYMQDDVRSELTGFPELRFTFDTKGAEVVFSDQQGQEAINAVWR